MTASDHSHDPLPAVLRHLDGVQAMRYVAAVGVLLVHLQWKLKQFYGVTMVPHITNTAVDLFFIISGFVIALVVRQQAATPLRFFARRVLRIYPLYFVLSVCAAIVFALRPAEVNSSGGVTNVLASFLLVPGPYKFLIENAWTIPHEFLFYALASLVFLLPARRSAALVAVMLVFLGIKLAAGHSLEACFIVGNFLTGILSLHATLWLHRLGVRLRGGAWLLVPLALAACVYADVLQPLTSNRLLAVNGVWGACLVIVTLRDLSGGTGAATRLLAALGDRSYSVYLVHPFVLKAEFLLLPRGAHSVAFLVCAVLAGIALSTAAGALSYRFIESWLDERLRALSLSGAGLRRARP